MSAAPLAILFDEPQDVPVRRDGTQSRFEMMSRASVEAVARAIRELGLAEPALVTTLELFEFVAARRRPPFSLAMNLSTGLMNRWRYAQGPMALELLDLPCSGSSLFTILICRDKHRCKMLCRDLVAIPPGVCIKSDRLETVEALDHNLFPAIVKPNEEGGSVGVQANAVVEDRAQAASRVASLLEDYPEGVLVEKFVPGTEVTCVVTGNGLDRQILPFALAYRDGSPLPESFVRTQQEKSDAFATGDRTWFHLHETHGDEIAGSVIDASRNIARELDLRDLSRLDYRVTPDGRVLLLEANAQPTFAPGNTALGRCGELVFRDVLGVHKAYVAAAVERVGLLLLDSTE